MTSQIKWTLIPTLAVAPALVSQAAYAIIYLDEQQAQQAIFGNAKMTKNFLTLTKDQAKQIKEKSRMDVRNNGDIKLWNVEGGGVFIVDEVLGKHEFITYGIGINKDGSVKGIEIMSYNETYGYEIRDESWRQQFVGKTSANQFKLDVDIKNISGATLSCKHVSEGVRRVLDTYDLLFKK